jgi:hypothetical protein
MTIKRTLTTLAALLAAALTVASLAVAAPRNASILIRHQVRGCHAWSVNGGAFKASQALALARNGSVTITNNDVMPHTLVQVSGPAAKLHSPRMAHMMAAARVFFPHAGVYVFKTKAGEDYPMMMKMETIGEDDVLRLVVTVR